MAGDVRGPDGSRRRSVRPGGTPPPGPLAGAGTAVGPTTPRVRYSLLDVTGHDVSRGRHGAPQPRRASGRHGPERRVDAALAAVRRRPVAGARSPAGGHGQGTPPSLDVLGGQPPRDGQLVDRHGDSPLGFRGPTPPEDRHVTGSGHPHHRRGSEVRSWCASEGQRSGLGAAISLVRVVGQDCGMTTWFRTYYEDEDRWLCF